MKDNLHGLSHDRWLIRIKDYVQIATTIGAVLWGGYQFIRKVDRLNEKVAGVEQKMEAVQRQVAFLQTALLFPKEARRAVKGGYEP